MADISAELAAIKSAVYGEEVRDSIHDGLQKMNSDLNTAIGHQVIDRATIDELLNNTFKLERGTALTGDENLDELLPVGNYFAPNSTIAGQVTNSPFTKAYSLKVISGGSGVRYQIALLNYGHASIKIRFMASNTWSDWETLATSESIPDAISSALGNFIDSTLTIENKAADAKAVGDKLNNVLYLTRTGIQNITEPRTNYDDLVTPGSYQCATTPLAKTMINAPFALPHRLIVMATTAAGRLYQFAFCNSATSTAIKFRSKMTDDEAWVPGNWIEIGGKEDIDALDARVTALENGSELPSYYFENNYIDERVDTIINNYKISSTHSDSFMFFTDPHYYLGSVNNLQNGLQACNIINYVMKRTNISKVVCGGDLVNGASMEASRCRELIKIIRKYLSPILEHTYMIIGNHEFNNSSGAEAQKPNMLTINELYPLLVKDKELTYEGVEFVNGSYWLDNTIQKIRYFFLGCNSDGNISREQLIWFVHEMESVPANYTVIVFSHVGLLEDLSYCGHFAQIVEVLDAAKAKRAFTYTWPGTTTPITGNYTSLNVTIAGVISGHIHRDLSKYSSEGIPIVAVVCDRGPKSSSSVAFKAARAYGTVNEQAIEVVQFDIDNRKLYCTRIGGTFDGEHPLPSPDRQFTF